jgi:uncharacterized membrane protein YkvA (DUF1232 family)
MDEDIRDLEQKVEKLSGKLDRLEVKVDKIDEFGWAHFCQLKKKTAWEVWILLILVIILFFIK